jgi:hypothetical protein
VQLLSPVLVNMIASPKSPRDFVRYLL